ncbi:MAG: patatin-like phospholipase family protein [Pseudomonadota bacterium]|nr:patatin-like phospholipase family protein [Pseudomonadota bacterium]
MRTTTQQGGGIAACPAPSGTEALRPQGRKRINIALQGGGAHGAFAWGVLDRLLEDGRLHVEGICGTSAGAMNATVAAYGLYKGGREGAREALARFWRKNSEAARTSPLQPTWLDQLISRGNMDFSPLWIFFDNLSRVMSPYQLNPLNLNPLRDLLLEVVDFEGLRRCTRVKLFLCASNVRSGRIKVFDTHEVSVDAVLASACLPFLFQAVEVDGEYYWDGGYMGNPPIYPLIYGTDVSDVLIIQINPINIPKVPTTAQEIMDRINTLSFNSSLMREMRAIHFVTRLIDDGVLDPARYKRIKLHTVHAEAELGALGVSSKLNANWDFLRYLFDLGRERADAWLAGHFDKVGVESSTDIAATFM